MPYTEQDIPRLKEILLGLIPVNGDAKSNPTLMNEFIAAAQQQAIALVPDEYWAIREFLIEDRSISIGRGRGGSVRRATVAVPIPAEQPAVLPPVGVDVAPAPRESDLYPPFLNTISQFFVSDYRIKLFIAEVTAQQGSRATGGKWTRPDVTLVAVKMHEFIPGKTIEVLSFEIKPTWSINIEGVFEASSHSAFANRSFLAIHRPPDVSDALIERLERECKRFGTGLILFDDVADWSTYDIRVDAKLHNPAPEDVDEFIGTQITLENRDKLRAWVR